MRATIRIWPQEIDFTEKKEGDLLYDAYSDVDDMASIIVFNPEASHCVSIKDRENLFPIRKNETIKGRIRLDFREYDRNGVVPLDFQLRLLNSGIFSECFTVKVHLD